MSQPTGYAEQLWLEWTANVDEVLLLLAQGYKRESFTAFDWLGAFAADVSVEDAAKQAVLRSGFFPNVTEEDLDDILGDDLRGDLGRYADEDDLGAQVEDGEGDDDDLVEIEFYVDEE